MDRSEMGIGIACVYTFVGDEQAESRAAEFGAAAAGDVPLIRASAFYDSKEGVA